MTSARPALPGQRATIAEETDVDHRLVLVTSLVGVFDVALADDEVLTVIADVEWVVLEHDVGGHHLSQTGDRDGLLVRTHRRPILAKDVCSLPDAGPSVCRQVGLTLVAIVYKVADGRYHCSTQHQDQRHTEQCPAPAPPSVLTSF